MPSIINSDDGVVSGSAGLKTTGGNDGILSLQNNGTTNVTVTAAGNVGIGTTSPSQKLHVVSSASQVASFIRDNTANASGGINIGNNSRVWTLYGDNSSLSIYDTTANLERAAIDSSGNFKFNSGYGSVATAYGCRAWVNFNGAGTLTGTYSQSGTAITVTITSHGLSQGQSVYITFQTGTASAEAFTVTSVTNANVFVVTSATSRTTSGNCTLATIIRASGNVSSVTDNGAGDYTVNFTTALVDANYSSAITSDNTNAAVLAFGADATTARTTTALRLRTANTSGTLTDAGVISVAIFR